MCFKIWHHPSWDLQGLVPVCCLLGFAALLKIKQVFIWFLQTFSSQRRYRKMVGMEERLSCSDASSVSSFLLPFFFFVFTYLTTLRTYGDVCGNQARQGEKVTTAV